MCSAASEAVVLDWYSPRSKSRILAIYTSSYTVYVEIFMVDLISLFSRVHAPTVKLKVKISFSNSHTSTSPITDDQLSPYTWKPLLVVCTSMMTGRATAVYYVCASWGRRLTRLK